MSKNLFPQLELLFWNSAIHVLSFFRSAHSSLSKTGRVVFGAETAFLGVLMGIAGVTGLASGYLFYFLTAHVR